MIVRIEPLVRPCDYILNVIATRSPIDPYKYMLLDRMKQDCKYFLGNGNRNEKYLWSSSVQEHIANMKALWNSFPTDQKPEWCTYEDIEKFGREMA